MDKSYITRWLKNIVTILIVFIFLINTVEFVEICLLSQPKEKCWIKFGIIMITIGLLFYIFYSFIWRKCLHIFQKSLYNTLSLHKKTPFLL